MICDIIWWYTLHYSYTVEHVQTIVFGTEYKLDETGLKPSSQHVCPFKSFTTRFMNRQVRRGFAQWRPQVLSGVAAKDETR